MLSKCANPNCDAPFQYLREGKLFRIDAKETLPQLIGKKPATGVEYFWLCGQCSPQMTLAFEREKGMVVVPIRPRAKRAVAMAS